MISAVFDAFFLSSKGEDFLILVDPEDFDRAEASGPWHIIRAGPALRYVQRNNPHPRRAAVSFEHMLHNLILGYKGIDHINGTGTDNRKENLRLATHSQNLQNRRLNSDNKSGFRGVFWSSREKRWYAQVKSGGKKYHLGSFTNKQAAAVAVLRGREQLLPFANESRHPITNEAGAGTPASRPETLN